MKEKEGFVGSICVLIIMILVLAGILYTLFAPNIWLWVKCLTISATILTVLFIANEP